MVDRRRYLYRRTEGIHSHHFYIPDRNEKITGEEGKSMSWILNFIEEKSEDKILAIFRGKYIRDYFYNFYVFYVEDGIIHLKHGEEFYDITSTCRPKGSPSVALEKISVRCNQRTKLFLNEKTVGHRPQFGNDALFKILKSSIGTSIDDLIPRINHYLRKRSNDPLETDQIRDHLVSVDKKIDIFGTGFRIYVLLNSSDSYESQVEFVRNNTKDILRFAIREAKESEIWERKIKDIRFYRVSDIRVSRMNELQIVFELKEGIIDTLTEGGGK